MECFLMFLCRIVYEKMKMNANEIKEGGNRMQKRSSSVQEAEGNRKVKLEWN